MAQEVPHTPEGEIPLNSFFSHARTRVVVAGSVMAVAALAAAGLTGAGIAAAQPKSPPVKVVTPSPTIPVDRYQGDPIYLYDLGIYTVAEQSQFQIRTHRDGYKKPVVADLVLGQGTKKTTKRLPKGLVPLADTLSNVWQFTVTDASGKKVADANLDWCPNTYQAARATPTGNAHNVFPYQCGNHPFALGGVFGQPKGWSAPVLNDWYNTPSFDGPDGTYTVQMSMKRAWRKALGVPLESARGSVKVTVTTYTDDQLGRTPAAPVAAQAAVAPLGQHSGRYGHAGHDALTAAQQLTANATHLTQREQLELARSQSLGEANATRKAPAKTLSKAAAAKLPKPDLRALPAYQIQLSRTDENGNPVNNTYVNFGATVWNAGPSPLLVDGFRRTGTGLMDAYQYFYDTKGKEVGSRKAGTLQWDPRPGHNHWHFTAFATYQLLDSSKKLAVRSGKEAFCLAPTDMIDLTVKGAQWRPESTDLSTACGTEGALSIREVLSTGWGDTYGQYLPGQSFDVTDLKNGIYYIQVLANPDKKLAETNTMNNSALRKVKLGGTVGGERTIKVYPYQGIDAP